MALAELRAVRVPPLALVNPEAIVADVNVWVRFDISVSALESPAANVATFPPAVTVTTSAPLPPVRDSTLAMLRVLPPAPRVRLSAAPPPRSMTMPDETVPRVRVSLAAEPLMAAMFVSVLLARLNVPAIEIVSSAPLPPAMLALPRLLLALTVSTSAAPLAVPKLMFEMPPNRVALLRFMPLALVMMSLAVPVAVSKLRI